MKIVGSPPNDIGSASSSLLAYAGIGVIGISLISIPILWNELGFLALILGFFGAVQGAMLNVFASMALNMARIDWFLSSTALPSREAAVESGAARQHEPSSRSDDVASSGAF